MQSVSLPLHPGMRVAATLMVVILVSSVLLCPVAWPWRIACALAVVVAGLGSWWRYLRRRPIGLTADANGRLVCDRPGQIAEEVVAVREGVVRPWLVSARLWLRDGSNCDLFVPGWALSAQAHWALRRALIGFRPPVAEQARAVDQSGGRRGT